MGRSKDKEIKIKGFKVIITASVPNEIDKIFPDYINLQDDFLNKVIESTVIALKHNTDLIESDKNLRVRFEDFGEVGSGFAASKESTSSKYIIRGSLRGWFREYIAYLAVNNLNEFIERAMVILIHEITHCNIFRKLSARDAIERFRSDKEKSFLLYLVWSIERQHEEGLAILRQAHALTEKGWHYKYHHDFRDFTVSMKTPSDFEDKAWVKFYKKIFPRGLSNMRDMVLAYRNRAKNFIQGFYLNKKRYENSDLKGFALNYAERYGYYDYLYGIMVCYFIFMARLNENDLDIIDFDTRRKIHKKDVARKFLSGDNIAIGRIEHSKFKRIFRRIKHLDVFDFYREYEEACIVLGIPEDFRLIDSEHVKELYSKKREIISWMR